MFLLLGKTCYRIALKYLIIVKFNIRTSSVIAEVSDLLIGMLLSHGFLLFECLDLQFSAKETKTARPTLALDSIHFYSLLCGVVEFLRGAYDFLLDSCRGSPYFALLLI